MTSETFLLRNVSQERDVTILWVGDLHVVGKMTTIHAMERREASFLSPTTSVAKALMTSKTVSCS